MGRGAKLGQERTQRGEGKKELRIKSGKKKKKKKKNPPRDERNWAKAVYKRKKPLVWGQLLASKEWPVSGR